MIMTSTTKKLALLVCGVLPPALLQVYGDYGRIYREFLAKALPKDTPFTLDSYDVVNKMEYPSEDQMDSYDALVYSGSAASAYENIEWINKLVEYTARIATRNPQIKLIGICFGHQIIGRAFGSECVRNDRGWELGPTPIDMTDIGKELFGVKNLIIHQMHRDHVPVLPPEFQLLGSTSVSNNQGMVKFHAGAKPGGIKLDDIHILTLQGHPEYNEGIVSGLVAIRSQSGIVDAEAAADAERRRYWKHDGVEVLGKTIWGVLGITA